MVGGGSSKLPGATTDFQSALLPWGSEHDFGTGKAGDKPQVSLELIGAKKVM